MPRHSVWTRARQARLPRALLIYLGAAWLVLQLAGELREALSLPSWVSPLVVLLLVVGLVIISATAWVQSRPGSAERAEREEIPGSWEVDLGDVRESVAKGRLPHLTWARSILGGVVAFSLLFGLAGAWVLLRGRPGAASAEERTMLAVLPFENLGSTEDEYFADGLTEEITARLAAIQRLGLISRTSTLQYKKTTKPIPEIGEELGVDYVLEGTVRWQPASAGTRRVRVTPQLIRVRDDSHVWASVYDENVTEIFDIQSDIAGQVVNALDITLGEPERSSLAARPTQNLEAYDYFLRGNDYYYNPKRRDDYDVALRMYEKAVELDPAFAVAHARVSRVHTLLYHFFIDRTEERLARGKRAADAAFRIDPDLPEAHVALGYWFYWGSRDYDRALREFATAQRSRPGDADVLEAVGFVQRRQGRYDEALENIRKAARLDPRSSFRALELTNTLLQMRRYTDAEREIDRAISLAPEAVQPHALRTGVLLAAGDLAKARAAAEEGIEAVGETQFVAALAGGWNLRAVERLLGERSRDVARRLGPSDFDADTVEYFFTRAELAEIEGDGERLRAYADSARALTERKLASRPDEADWHTQLGVAYALLGDGPAAIREARRAVELLPRSRDALTTTHWGLALVLALVGEDEAAVDELESILSAPGNVSPAIVRDHPAFSRLHDNPRFRKLAGLGGA